MWGTDLSSYAIDLAKERVPNCSERLQAGPIDRVPYPEYMFGAICM